MLASPFLYVVTYIKDIKGAILMRCDDDYTHRWI